MTRRTVGVQDERKQRLISLVRTPAQQLLASCLRRVLRKLRLDAIGASRAPICEHDEALLSFKRSSSTFGKRVCFLHRLAALCARSCGFRTGTLLSIPAKDKIAEHCVRERFFVDLSISKLYEEHWPCRHNHLGSPSGHWSLPAHFRFIFIYFFRFGNKEVGSCLNARMH